MIRHSRLYAMEQLYYYNENFLFYRAVCPIHFSMRVQVQIQLPFRLLYKSNLDVAVLDISIEILIEYVVIEIVNSNELYVRGFSMTRVTNTKWHNRCCNFPKLWKHQLICNIKNQQRKKKRDNTKRPDSERITIYKLWTCIKRLIKICSY